MRVRRIKNQYPRPRAWCIDEVRRLLAESRKQRGCHASGVPWVLWWDALIRLAWDSALRVSDVLEVRWSDIASDGTLTVTQLKTSNTVTVRLHRSTIEAIKATHPDRRKTILGRTNCARFFFKRFRTMVRKAGIRRGSSKWLRRSSATAVEAIQPGSAPGHLGHRSPDLAYRHYVDHGLLPIARPMPPEL